MQRFEDHSKASDLEKQHQEWETAIDQALKKARAESKVDIIVHSQKPGVANINLIVDDSGRSIHFVNAISKSLITVKEVKFLDVYPDILIDSNNFNVANILKKIAEHLNLHHDIGQIKINAYKTAQAFQENRSLGIFDPNVRPQKTAA